MTDAPFFVARHAELSRLRDKLGLALAAEGQICFVTGEAGAGKTSLATEFARRSQDEQAELLVAVGNCNAQTGICDPYLPFRELLAQLTGDVDAKVIQGAISQESATRLQNFLSVSGRAIVDLGPDLIDIFLPGASLVARAGQFVSGDATWTKKLSSLREKQSDRAGTDIGGSNPHVHEQGQIFDQFTRVLLELAEQRPLLLILDDLHWADESSTALLFHLARRIHGSRIMLLCTYRSEDVALGRRDRRHPLDSVVNEIKRIYGEVMVPVAEGGEASGREFIDALLDSQPNRLGPAFREKLLRHTRGHPLFTTELLKGMMKRGDLQKNEQGEVIEGPELVWDAIPARVEGVIEERIHRLPEDLQELLVVASVQGESFAAQIAARIQGMSERDALRALDKELHQQHQLVREQGITRVGRQRLSRYRFRHNLIQRYLYGRISQSEREILHEDIAQALEEIYEGQTEEVAGELARHYELAEMPDRATELYLQLGERAMRIFANSEAAELLERGLDLVADLPESAENDERAVRLHLALGRAQWRQGLAPESMATFQRAAHLGRKLNSGVYMAEAALGYDDPRYRFNLPIEPAVELLEKALEALGDGDSVLRVQVVWALIRAQGHEMNETVLGALAENAIAMARRLQDPAALYSALNAGTQALRRPDQIRQRLMLRDEAVEVAAASGDTSSLLDAIMYRTIDLLALAEIDALDAGLATMEEVVEEIGEPFFEYCMLNLRAMRSLLDGRFEEAEAFAHGAMDCSQKMTVDKAEGVYGLQMFSIRRLQGQLESLAPVIRHFVATHSAAESWRPGLALIYSEIGDEESARSEFEALAEAGFGNLPKDSLWLTCQSYLADVCAFLGDSARAGELYDILKPYGQQAVVVGNSITCNGAVSRSLGRLAAVLQDWERAEEHFNHAIAFNEKLGAAPWLAISKFQYAQMLLDRGQAGDPERAEGLLSEAREIAQAIGMHGLKARIAGPGD